MTAGNTRRMSWMLGASLLVLAGCEALLSTGSLGERGPGADGGTDGTANGEGGPDAPGQPGPDASEAGDAHSFTDGDTGTDTGSSVTCPAGLQCNVPCSGATTSISGTVYDPAGRNPLYNVAVYVPLTPLQPLPKGVPTGADACSCGALFKSGAAVSTRTDVDGTFTLTNAPVGTSVPLVIQAGKWRRQITIDVNACAANAITDKSLLMPSSIPAGDTTDNLPDIAVSTGAADTLECLLTRVGLPASEYVAGSGGPGHVHIFAGGSVGGGGGGGGLAETPAMPGAPPSPASLWATADQLMPYDIVLLSCEGGETYQANPPALEQYLDVGGRAFASHYHYAWFSGPLETTQSYTAPPDWGSNLASWSASPVPPPSPIGASFDLSLNGSSAPFAKGQALEQWLTLVGALGQNGVPPGELSIYQPRTNAVVGPANAASQPWILYQQPATADAGAGPTESMYFSFDTPVGAPPDGGPPKSCGRAVFSDLHVSGDPATLDSPPPPGGCATGVLSPQERALEFMLFDLSTCVIPDSVAPPPPDAGLPGL